MCNPKEKNAERICCLCAITVKMRKQKVLNTINIYFLLQGLKY